MKTLQKICLTIFIAINCNGALADQNIQIIGGNQAGLPTVAVVTFNNDLSNNNNITNTVMNDLMITGEFSVKQYNSASDVESSIQCIITGSIDNNKLNYTITPNIQTTTSKKTITGSINIDNNDIRHSAHQLSNLAYKNFTNINGIFTSKIAFIIRDKSKYELIISDYDGYNQKVMLTTNSPIISVTWNKTGDQIAYASFETNKPVVYVQDVYKVNRYKIANFNGSNSSPAFSLADNSKLAVTLSKDYGSHIYLVSNKPNSPTANKLINFGTIDTEANIGKNGSIVFTSNHDGGPQIFMTDMKGSTPVRITQQLGNYNTTARLSHDLSKITFINRNSGVLKTYVMDLGTKSAYPVSQNTSLDMAPTFSPNDKLILFSSNNSMYITNTTGTTQTRLKNISGDIIDQSWANNFE